MVVWYHMYMSMVVYVIIWLYEYMNICDIICCIMWDCKCGYMYVYGYTGVMCYVCTVCVICYDDLRLIYTCVIWSCVMSVLWSQDCGFGCAAWLEFFTCSFVYYILWINYEHNMYDLCILYGWIVNI